MFDILTSADPGGLKACGMPSGLAERVRSGRLKPIIGAVRPLAEVPSAFAPDHRVPGKTIIRVTQDG